MKFENRYGRRMPDRLQREWQARARGAKPAVRIESKGSETELLLYGVIGMDFWTGDGITSKDVAEQLQQAGDKSLRVRINSPGGDVFEGLGIYTALSQYAGDVAVQIDSLAASAAAVVAMAGDTIEIAPAALMMIHDAWGLLVGNAQDAREFADVLDKIDTQIAGTFAGQTGKSAEDIRKAMDAESWYTAEEAVAFGLADGILADKKKPDEEDPDEEDPYASAEARQRAAAAARAKLRLRELDSPALAR
jgi:ATP-dependent Clp endopeptidase proteolytic subunit ClpP